MHTNPKSNMLARPIATIPLRDSSAPQRLVDLGAYYSHALDDDIHHKPGNTLASLPKGLQSIQGTLFDLRGVVQLAAARSEEITTLTYPPSVVGIPVGVSGHRLHFLHASAWGIEAAPTPIGEYVIHFDGKPVHRIPVVYKENAWDWWESNERPDGSPAWKGQNSRTTERGIQIRLFKLTWENPFPATPIRSIDLVSCLAGPAPMIVAISVE